MEAAPRFIRDSQFDGPGNALFGVRHSEAISFNRTAGVLVCPHENLSSLKLPSRDGFPSHAERRSLRGIKAPLFWWPLGSLLLVWGLLYLPHLRDSPACYGDETGTLLIGRDLFGVKVQSAPSGDDCFTRRRIRVGFADNEGCLHNPPGQASRPLEPRACLLRSEFSALLQCVAFGKTPKGMPDFLLLS